MKKTTLHIKNMVCDRCVLVLDTALRALGVEVDKVQLGRADVILKEGAPGISEIEKELNRFNFGLIADKETEIAEKIKITLIGLVDSDEIEDEDFLLSDYLAKKLTKNYGTLSRIFSKKAGLTIEKYFIRLRIEKAKELVRYGKQSFSEIAYSLGYKNLQHLSRQFKEITGMSMSEYQKLQNPPRTALNRI